VRLDLLTSEPVRKSASEALAAIDAPPAKPAAPAPEPEPKTVAAKAPPTDTRPRYLSKELIEQALKPAASKLQACLSSAAGAPATQARVSMTIDGQGQVEKVFVTPPDAQTCIEPLVRAQPFPATQQGRQNVAHVVQARSDKPKAASAGKPKTARTLARADKQP